MRSHVFAVFIALLFVVVACAPAAPAREPAAVVPEGTPETPYDEPQVTARADDAAPNPDIVALMERASGVNGYSFQLATLPEKAGSHVYAVRDGFARVTPVNPIAMDGWSADIVIVDYVAKTATAYCVKLAQCKGKTNSGAVDFEEYAPKLPTQWLEEAQYGEKTGAVQFNKRPCTIVRWPEGDITYEAYLDNYYGFPQRVAVVSGEGEDAVVISGYEYQSMTFNTVKAADVQPPY